jgi:hypothetical protein
VGAVNRPLAANRKASRTLPNAVWLGAAMAFAVLTTAGFGGHLPVPWIVPDEILYSELAKSLAAGSAPAIRGTTSFGYGVVYPLLIAPAWVLFRDPESAYAAAKIINSVLWALAALPAYAIAARFVSARHAIVVAVLAVLLPSVVYAGVVMPESAYYPLFLLVVLTFVRALERPSVARQLVVLGAIAVAVATEPKSVALLPAFVSAVALSALLDHRSEGKPLLAGLMAFRVTWALAALGLVVGAVTPTLALGAYSGALTQLDLVHVPRQLAYNLGNLDLLVGFAPFAASILIIAAGLGRASDRRERLFVSLTVPLLGATLLLVSAFRLVDVHNDRHVLTERNVFYLAPFFLIGLMMWFERSSRTGRFLLIPVLAATAVAPALMPLRDLGFNARFQAPSAVLWIELRASDTAMLTLLVGFGACMTALVLLSRRWMPFAPFVLGVVFFLGAGFARSSMQAASDWTQRSGGTAGNWIDRVAGPDASVALVWREGEPRNASEAGVEVPLRAEHRLVYLAEFFNRSVGTVYSIGRPPPYASALPIIPARVSFDGTLVTTDGTAVHERFVLAPCPLALRGDRVATDPSTGTRLVRTDGIVRLRGETPTCTRRSSVR